MCTGSLSRLMDSVPVPHLFRGSWSMSLPLNKEPLILSYCGIILWCSFRERLLHGRQDREPRERQYQIFKDKTQELTATKKFPHSLCEFWCELTTSQWHKELESNPIHLHFIIHWDSPVFKPHKLQTTWLSFTFEFLLHL